MTDPEAIAQAEAEAEWRARGKERRTTAAVVVFLVLVTLGSLWLAGVLEWVALVFRMVAGS